ncbi:MAG: DUF4276 family protein [Bryobacteraceae bacterium]
MTRLYIVCEGLTEVNFVTQLLKPHLEAPDPLRLTVGAPNLRGHYTYAQLKKFVKNLLATPSSPVAVTTMVDLFKIPGDHPGIAEASDEAPVERVHHLENECTEDIGDRRFFSHLQLHEFEALLLADLTVLVKQHPNRRNEIGDLAARLNRDFPSPEHVDRLHPPSYRIKDAVPEYNKTVDGPTTASGIGLPRLRERCPHFGQWLQHLEDLSPA